LHSESSRVLRFAAFGAIAFIVACVSHEAVGHAGACLATGGQVELLTSVYFRCRPGVPLVDAAGPLMNLAVAAVALLVLRARNWPATTRAFIALILGVNAMWGAGCLPHSAFADAGDFSFVLRADGVLPQWAWRFLLVIVGLSIYAGAMRVISPHLPKGRVLAAAYFAAALTAVTSVLFHSGPLLPAIREALVEGALGPIGLLYLALFGKSVGSIGPVHRTEPASN
jgi:hypothetical protein